MTATIPRKFRGRSPITRETTAAAPKERRSVSVSDAFSGASNFSGVAVTERSALTLTAAFACMNVVSTDIACLPCELFRKRKGEGQDKVTDTVHTAVLQVSPDGETTAMRAEQAVMGHVLGWGNGYQEIERLGNGQLAKLHRLDPSTTEPKRRASDRHLFYKLANGKTLVPEDVLHIAGLGFDGLVGYSPVRLARQAIGLGLATETFGSALFGNGSTPRGVLEVPTTLTDEAYQRLRESFEEIHAGVANAHRIALLEQGTKWNQTSINPEDAQFLATRAFQVVEVCRIYRVPPHKVGDYSQAHLANIESSNLDYLMTTLMPWCMAIEQEYNLKLLTAAERAAGFYFEHSLRTLLRADSKTRAEYYRGLRDLGVLTPNMINALEGFNPIGPAGDIRLVPLNMIDLTLAGKPTPSKGLNDGSL